MTLKAEAKSQSPQSGAHLRTSPTKVPLKAKRCLNPLKAGHIFGQLKRLLLQKRLLKSQSPQSGAHLRTLRRGPAHPRLFSLNPLKAGHIFGPIMVGLLSAILAKSQSPQSGAHLRTVTSSNGCCRDTRVSIPSKRGTSSD